MLLSPKSRSLEGLEGSPETLSTGAQKLVTAAATMETAAEKLKLVSQGNQDLAVGKAIETVRERAGEIAPALTKAAIRYRATGNALSAYAEALRTAQWGLDDKIEAVWTAHTAAQDAREQETSVILSGGGLDSMANPTAVEKAAARDAIDDAGAAVAAAKSELDSAWEAFDQTIDTWSEAYDVAVDAIEDGFDKAGNSDAWGEDFLDILGWIGTGLAIAALFCTGPIAVAIMAVGAAIAAVVLVINILKYAKGRGNLADTVMAAVGVIPFARPFAKFASGPIKAIKAARGAKGVFATGRGMVRPSIGSTVRTTTRKTVGGRPRPGVTKPVKLKPRSAAKIDRITDARVSEFLDGFGKNAIGRRVADNLFRGGYSKSQHLADYVLNKSTVRVGADLTKWANSVYRGSTLGSKAFGISEGAASTAVTVDWFGNKFCPPYRSFRESLGK